MADCSLKERYRTHAVFYPLRINADSKTSPHTFCGSMSSLLVSPIRNIEWLACNYMQVRNTLCILLLR